MADFEYPQVGFHFKVEFELPDKKPVDIRFQEVSGLKATVTTEAVSSGGSMPVPELPVKIKYDDLVLKRGLFTDSAIRDWCLKAIEQFQFEPVNINIMLLDEKHETAMNWYVVGAYPVSWEVSGFDASKNGLTIESVTLKYDHFRTNYKKEVTTTK